MLIIAIILILSICFCLGWKELANSFSDIHVADILRVWPFLICLLVAMSTGTGLIILHENSYFMAGMGEVITVLVSMALTLVLMSTINRPYSTVTIFWGVLLAMKYTQEGHADSIIWATIMVSIIIAPLLSMAASVLFHSMIRSYIEESNMHLLMKQLYTKWIAYVGLILGGIALACNYGLFIDSLFTPLYRGHAGNWCLWLFVVAASVVCLSPIVRCVYQRSHSNGMSRHVSSLYAQTLVMTIMNTLLPLTTGFFPPVLVSANLLKESNTLILEREKESRSVMNIVSIAVTSPLLAFLIGAGMRWFYARPYIFWAASLFTVLVCSMIRLYYVQYKKNKYVSRMLSDELRHRDEVSHEMNRLDVMAVTSQFDSMTREIDFKHRELIDLSLFVQQQREYMTEVGTRLRRLIQENSIESIKKSLTDIDRDLKDTLRYPPEMEKIYQDVEKMHHDFVCRLQMRCPNLSERERRLAILLRLGFSSKEIASIVNLETKSIEINRYRLRKKLQLDRGENLVSYLQML